MKGDFLTPGEVASVLKLPIKTIRAFIASGHLRAARFGRALRIARSDLDRLVDSVSSGAPPRPPQGEVLGFSRGCGPVNEDVETCAWLRELGLDPERIGARDLVRTVALETDCPPWARFGSADWFHSGHRVLLPLWDARGELRSLRAIRVGEARADVPAVLDPFHESRPFPRKGLVLTEMVSLAVLRHPSAPPEDHAYAVEMVRQHGFWIVPDELQFLSLASEWRIDADRPGVIGVLSGAWTAELAAKIPDGCTVTLLTGAGRAGARLATTVGRSLAPRVSAGKLAMNERPGRQVQRG